MSVNKMLFESVFTFTCPFGETPKYIPVPNVDKLFKLNYKKRFFIDFVTRL